MRIVFVVQTTFTYLFVVKLLFSSAGRGRKKAIESIFAFQFADWFHACLPLSVHGVLCAANSNLFFAPSIPSCEYKQSIIIHPSTDSLSQMYTLFLHCKNIQRRFQIEHSQSLSPAHATRHHPTRSSQTLVQGSIFRTLHLIFFSTTIQLHGLDPLR